MDSALAMMMFQLGHSVWGIQVVAHHQIPNEENTHESLVHPLSHLRTKMTRANGMNDTNAEIIDNRVLTTIITKMTTVTAAGSGGNSIINSLTNWPINFIHTFHIEKFGILFDLVHFPIGAADASKFSEFPA